MKSIAFAPKLSTTFPALAADRSRRITIVASDRRIENEKLRRSLRESLHLWCSMNQHTSIIEKPILSTVIFDLPITVNNPFPRENLYDTHTSTAHNLIGIVSVFVRELTTRGFDAPLYVLYEQMEPIIEKTKSILHSGTNYDQMRGELTNQDAQSLIEETLGWADALKSAPATSNLVEKVLAHVGGHDTQSIFKQPRLEKNLFLDAISAETDYFGPLNQQCKLDQFNNPFPEKTVWIVFGAEGHLWLTSSELASEGGILIEFPTVDTNQEKWNQTMLKTFDSCATAEGFTNESLDALFNYHNPLYSATQQLTDEMNKAYRSLQAQETSTDVHRQPGALSQIRVGWDNGLDRYFLMNGNHPVTIITLRCADYYGPSPKRP
ncbi:MAG: hypothetical protein ACK5NY_04915 [Burkholderiaceae bacterium]